MDNPHILLSLLFYGILGLIGQGVRAVVGLGSAANPGNPVANQQSVFNAAYLLFTLMIGFIAGFLAGLVNYEHVTDALTLKMALGVIVAGYAGADFIESTYSGLTGMLLGAAPAGRPADVATAAAIPLAGRPRAATPPAAFSPAATPPAAEPQSAAAPVTASDSATAQRLNAAEDRLSRLEAMSALPPPPGLSAGPGPV